MSDVRVYLKIFVAVFVLVNPLEGIPMFLAFTQGLGAAARGAVARTTAIAVTAILLGALAIGRGLLAVLGITIGAFTVAGGIIIFLVALKMVLGRPGESKAPAADDAGAGQRFAIVPLAMPLLAGPGAISSVIVYASKGPEGNGCSLADYVILAGVMLVVGGATWLSLRAADPMRRLLGDTGIDVATRISGILVAAIAVGMVHEGLVLLVPALAG